MLSYSDAGSSIHIQLKLFFYAYFIQGILSVYIHIYSNNINVRYPKETMQLIAELAQDIVGDYRERQKNKLQRTFVKASDAASSKVKGISKNCEFYQLQYYIVNSALE